MHQMSQPPNRAEQLFEKALDLPVGQRAEFIRISCERDISLLQRVTELLRLAVDDDDDDYKRPGDADHYLGTRIDRYQLTRVLGEGGFGVVYLAEQTDPVKRLVALKILKPGMDTAAVLRRFDAERRTLAMLDHPDISRLLDAGQTQNGCPYFVMEYVVGTSISEYCDAMKLTINARLDLFSQVCRAVQHAHTKGVIHRDLKPSNILVSTIDGRATVKLIDFGISKLLEVNRGVQGTLTGAGLFIGTPNYMSPEQAANSAAIDTRSDVYSLGVVLYELLIGALPFGRESFGSKSPLEISRVLIESDPPTPSARLLTMADRKDEAVTRIERGRGVSIQVIIGTLRKELEWIPLKAMRREPIERYQSAAELEEDVQNYLSSRPLRAGPESKIYRAKKYMRRHPGAVTSVSIVLLALLVGFAATLWQWRTALMNEQRARALLRFMSDSLISSDSSRGGSQDFTVRQAMAQAISRLDSGALRSQPVAEADLQFTISRVLGSNGDYAMAIELSLQAGRTLESVFGPKHQYFAQSLNNLADLYREVGDYSKAEPLYIRALRICEETLGSSDPDVGIVLANLGSLYSKQARYLEAEPLLKRSLNILESARGSENPDIAVSLSNLAWLYDAMGEYEQARSHYERALQIYEGALAPNNRRIASALNNLASQHFKASNFSKAESLFKRALEIDQTALGPDHPAIATTLSNLAMVYNHQGRTSEAASLYERALVIKEKAVGPDHPDVASIASNLASLMVDSQQYTQAEVLYRRTLAIDEKAFGENHPSVGKDLNNLGELFLEQEMYDEAEAFLQRSLRIKEASRGVNHPSVAVTLRNLGGLYLELDQFAKAEELYKRALTIHESALSGQDSKEIATNLRNLARLYLEQHRYSECETFLNRALEMRTKVFGSAHPETVAIIRDLSRMFKNWHEAEPTKGYAERAVQWNAKLPAQ